MKTFSIYSLGKVYRKLRSKIFIGKWVMAIKTDEENWEIIDNKLYSWEAIMG